MITPPKARKLDAALDCEERFCRLLAIGKRIAANTAMTAITTNNSTKVNPAVRLRQCTHDLFSAVGA